MKFEEYESIFTKNTAENPFRKTKHSLLFASNALGGECGELQNMIKKVYRDNNADPSDMLPAMMLELGDILYSWN
ncbi:hypothetical protein L9G74_20795, partial [Shewanella sp. C32]